MSNKNYFFFDGSLLTSLTPGVVIAARSPDGSASKFISLRCSNTNTDFISAIGNLNIYGNGNGLINIINSTSNVFFTFAFRPAFSQFLFCPTTQSNYCASIALDLNKNYDHPSQTNPTLFIHSATDPDSDNTQWIGLTHNQTNPVLSWGKGELVLTGPTASLTLTKTGGTDLADAIVKPTTLKTATGEVSTNNTAGQNLVLPGGEYGFYPQVKREKNPYTVSASIVSALNDGTYQTIIFLWTSNNASYAYAQQRYVTASGLDHWLFCLVEKSTGKITAAYSAPDHPAYNNGGDVDTLQHPFPGYDDSVYDVVILDNASIDALKAARQGTKKSLLEVLNEGFTVDITKEKTYTPLHTGEFLTVEKLVDTVAIVDVDNPAFNKEKPAEEQKDVPEKIGQEQIVKVLKPFQEPVKLAALPSFISVRAIKAKG